MFVSFHRFSDAEVADPQSPSLPLWYIRCQFSFQFILLTRGGSGNVYGEDIDTLSFSS